MKLGKALQLKVEIQITQVEQLLKVKMKTRNQNQI